ncbi:MAG: threonine/serine exporter family protein [Verrucomicrobiota bacterium JB022]|nr:threonine/serine exporter family protein [Verrucomicrobiota bacterium JB022]
MFVILYKACSAALAALGFAVLFNVPKRTLVACALCGAFGVSLRLGLLHWSEHHMHLAAATLIAAGGVSLLGEFFSRLLNAPPAVFTVPGVIPMVPGSLMFRTMVGFLRHTNPELPIDYQALGADLQLGLTAFLTLTALAVGIAMPNLLFYRRRPEI